MAEKGDFEPTPGSTALPAPRLPDTHTHARRLRTERAKAARHARSAVCVRMEGEVTVHRAAGRTQRKCRGKGQRWEEPLGETGRDRRATGAKTQQRGLPGARPVRHPGCGTCSSAPGSDVTNTDPQPLKSPPPPFPCDRGLCSDSLQCACISFLPAANALEKPRTLLISFLKILLLQALRLNEESK